MLKTIWLFHIYIIACNFAASTLKTWRWDTSITNQDNWEGVKGCQGIIFAPINNAPIYINHLSIASITLPSTGVITLLENSWIQFKPNRKCIKLKPLNYHYWNDPNSWLGPKRNPAIPDVERLPCSHDDIILPNGIHSGIYVDPDVEWQVNTLKIAKRKIVHSTFDQIQRDNLGKRTFINPPTNLIVKPQLCLDPTGCLCHKYQVYCQPEQIDYDVESAQKKCIHPIEPFGFCRKICGASITLNPHRNFNIEQIKSELNQINIVNTHISKIQADNNKNTIQIIFAEDDYTGRSVEEAKSFYSTLIDSQNNFDIIEMQVSGPRIGNNNYINVLTLIFSTLVAVLVFFAIIFYVYGIISMPTQFYYTRTNLRPFFARYDNTNENLIISGSQISLERSFDNPMYDKDETTTTSSTSTDEHNTSNIKSETTHENPLYDVTVKNQDQTT